MITQELLKSKLNYDYDTGIFTWRVNGGGRAKKGSITGCLDHTNGYLRSVVNGKLYYVHRLAWLYCYGTFPKNFIDHIDCNKTNNAILNLREATNSQNLQNRRTAQPNNATGILGVSFFKRTEKFTAQIGTNGKMKHLGYFTTAEEASVAYIKAKREFHEFCTI